MSKTPIERAADALGANGAEGSDEDLLADARAVFESIDRQWLIEALWQIQIGRPEDPADWPEHYADALKAALLTGGES